MKHGPTTYTPSVSLTRLLWAVAVALAVVVVGVAYLDRRSDGETVTSPFGDGETSTTVFVAKQLIPAGTLVRPRMFDFLTVRQDEVEAGTLTDIKHIALHYVAHPIYPGERLSVSDFSP
jgi:Flp pilus assembly protein CpaB